MNPLQPPNTHHLLAAVGWLELGNSAEAGEEIAKINPDCLAHPDVLEVRWEICAAGRAWEAAFTVADQLVRVAPERASGWIHRAYATRRAPGGGLPQAFEALRPAWEAFPEETTIPYNLACYTAQLGRLEEAWNWLQKALSTASVKRDIQGMALADPDLQPLWERIRKLA